MAKKKATDWIVVHDCTKGDDAMPDAMAIKCQRCETEWRFTLPLPLSIWLSSAKVFQVQHAKCKEG